MLTILKLKRKPPEPVPKPLVDIAADFLCNVLVESVLNRDNPPKKPNSTLWRDPKWTQLKEWLGKAPLHLQEMICSRLFAAPSVSSILSSHSRPNATLSLAPWLKARNASGKELFLLWWLFLDLETTEFLPIPSHELDGNFFLQQVTLFSRAQAPAKLTRLSMAFNWIVRRDFERSLRNLPGLKQLTLQGSFSNDLFALLSDCSCRLSTLEARGVTSGRVTPQAMVRLIEAKSDFLSSMDLCQFEDRLDFSSDAEDRASILGALATCKQLADLALPADYIKCSGKTPIMENVRDLSVHFQSVEPEPLSDIQVLMSLLTVFPLLCRLKIHNVALPGNADEVLEPLYDKITVFSGISTGFNVLRFLASLSNIRDFHLKCHHTPTHPPPEAVEWKCHLPHLRFLHVKDSLGHFRFQDLKQVLLGSPKLQRVSLQCKTVTDFDENDFIESIQRERDALCDLKYLRLKLSCGNDEPTVSEKLVVKILERAANLESLYTDIRRSYPFVSDSLLRVALEKRFEVSLQVLQSS